MAARRSSRLRDLDFGPNPYLRVREWLLKTMEMMAIVHMRLCSAIEAMKDRGVHFGGKERRRSGGTR